MACSSDETTEAKPAQELLMVEKEVSMPASETSWSVKVTADCHWEVTSVENEGWGELTISPRSGDGNGTLLFTSEKNRSSLDRMATIILSTKGGLEQRISLRQMKSDAALSVNKEEFSFSNTGGTQSLVISSNSNWTIEGLAGISWLELGQTNGGSGTTEVPIHVKEAYDDASRNAQLLITAGGSNISVTVSQSGLSSISLSVSATELPKFAGDGGAQTLTVTCNAAWYAYVPSSASWIQLEPAFGIGNGEIRVVCGGNPSIRDERQATFIVTAGTKTVQQCDILVKQEPAEEVIIPEEPHNPDPHLSR
jgi:hypothetical protein